ncbi:MAG: type II toxin-antitoxin system VapC family toxin [Verrucomicrobia bacterium]|nr:type II toxin-antitoxin system VapC family toxin [Verrucomicrobiota bacterium]
MIVVDANVLAYLFIPGDLTDAAEALLRKEPEWAAPIGWREVFRNVVAVCLKQKALTLQAALRAVEYAEEVLKGQEYNVPAEQVLKLAERSGCQASDCEYVVLAQDLDVPLVTTDEQIVKEFPKVAKHLKTFARSSKR